LLKIKESNKVETEPRCNSSATILSEPFETLKTKNKRQSPWVVAVGEQARMEINVAKEREEICNHQVGGSSPFIGSTITLINIST